MRRTLEAIFRRPLQLLALLILLPLVSLASIYFLAPRTYQSTASLLALRRYEIIGATGPESDLTATPADTQVAGLLQLLQVRSFALAISHESNLAPTLNLSKDVLSSPARLDDALFNEISHNVTVTSHGPNLYEISYANRNRQVAQRVVELVIAHFGVQSTQISVGEGQRLVASYQQELADAQSKAKLAATTESTYIAAHPHQTPQDLASDPQYALLDAQRLQAQATVQTIQDKISSVNQSISTLGTNVDSLYTVIDTPSLPSPGQSVSRLKLYLLSGGIGLGLAILAVALYIIILVRRDRGVYTTSDLQKVTMFPMVMQLPHFAPTTMQLLAGKSEQSSVVLSEVKQEANNRMISTKR